MSKKSGIDAISTATLEKELDDYFWSFGYSKCYREDKKKVSNTIQ